MLVWNTKGTLWRQKLVQKVQRLLSLLAGWLASCAVQSAVCKLCSDSSLQLSGLPSSAPCSSRLLAAMFSHWRRSLRHDQKGTVRHFAQYNAHSRRLKLWFLNFKLHLIQSKTDYNKHNHKTQATRTHKYIYPSVLLSLRLSVSPSVWRSALLHSAPTVTDSHEIWYLITFRKIRRESTNFFKILKENLVLYMETNTHLR